MMELLDTPPEMLIAVSSKVAKSDLPNFRLACKATAAASLDSFAKAYFTELNHLFTTQSLQLLHNIASKPCFAKHVKIL
jgi:hypothetical protein